MDAAPRGGAAGDAGPALTLTLTLTLTLHPDPKPNPNPNQATLALRDFSTSRLVEVYHALRDSGAKQVGLGLGLPKLNPNPNPNPSPNPHPQPSPPTFFNPNPHPKQLAPLALLAMRMDEPAAAALVSAR